MGAEEKGPRPFVEKRGGKVVYRTLNHNGYLYKYRHDEHGEIEFLGPVGDAPQLSEQDFLRIFKSMKSEFRNFQTGEKASIVIMKPGEDGPPIPPPTPDPCQCGVEYLKQGIIWWCSVCKNNFVVE